MVHQRTQFRDLLLPIAVVAVVGMMVFPLPRAVLDVLLMLNIAFALSLLISSVYLSEPGTFTALPTILLLATIFRLGLNVSTTRQLLAHGEAPDVVAAFGNFVVSGNLVVGFVVFAIVTLVQFLVIAKGAERIAEVAARFTLDAMPGKQMSIDADVRAGILSIQEAQEKRRELHRESKLYGALDGAMKFVKGDAIAGLLITLINITAGLVVGVSQQGLSFGAAAQKYSIFTIGDGLVSQIPALLVAVGAGIAVTRVENQDRTFVGRDVFSQLSKEPQALATTGMVLVSMAFVPGLPSLPCFAAGLLLLFFSYRGAALRKLQSAQAEESQFRPKLHAPISLLLSQGALRKLRAEGDFARELQALRERFFDKWGVLLPDIQFDIDSENQKVKLDVLIHGTPLISVGMHPSTPFGQFVIEHLERLLRNQLPELIDDTQTRLLLETHGPLAEDLINSVIPEMLSVTGLTTLLRRLVEEGVQIREMRTILQAIAEFQLASDTQPLAAALPRNRRLKISPQWKALFATEQQPSPRAPELLEHIREALGRSITKGAVDRLGKIRALTLDPEFDVLLSQTALSGAPLLPEFGDYLRTSVDRLSREHGSPLVVLCSRTSRSSVADILARHSTVAALSIYELSPDVEVRVLNSINLPTHEDQNEPVAASCPQLEAA